MSKLLIALLLSGCSVTVIKPVANYHQTIRDCTKVMSVLKGNQIDGVSTAMWCAQSENLHRFEADMKVAKLVMEHRESMIEEMEGEQ
jgi:hypothetical protein